MYIQADCIFQTLLIFHRTDFERIVSRRQIGVSNRSARSLGPHFIEAIQIIFKQTITVTIIIKSSKFHCYVILLIA